MGHDEETVTFEDVEAIIETDAALFVHMDADADNIDFNEPGKAGQSDGRWVPKSVIHDDSEVYAKGGEGKLVVKEWWARKNSLA